MPPSVRRIDSARALTTLPGVYNFPDGVAVDASGAVYVADTSSNRVCAIEGSGCALLADDSGAGADDGNGASAKFNIPTQLAVDVQGRVWVADSENKAIRSIDASGNVTTFAHLSGRPYGVAVDSAGNVYASDIDGHRLLRFAADGHDTADIKEQGLRSPRGIRLDSNGRVLVANTGTGEIPRVPIAR